MKAPYWSKEIVNQFIDSFAELAYDDISFREYLHTIDVIFLSKKNRRIIRFAVSWNDFIDIYISKPRTLYFTISPDVLFYKHSFSFHDVLNCFPNNNLTQFINYKYHPNYEEIMYETLLKKRKTLYSKEESEDVFQNTVKEHILFLKENLMPVISGEMWIDELLKQKKK